MVAVVVVVVVVVWWHQLRGDFSVGRILSGPFFRFQMINDAEFRVEEPGKQQKLYLVFDCM